MANCAECGRLLGPRCPSDDFCSDLCQTYWHRHLADPLPTVVGYPYGVYPPGGVWPAVGRPA